MAGPGGKEVGRVTIRVVPDTSKFNTELRAQLEKLSKGLKVDVPINLDTTKAFAEAKAFEKELDGTDVTYDVKLDSRGVTRDWAKTVQRMLGQTEQMSRNQAAFRRKVNAALNTDLVDASAYVSRIRLKQDRAVIAESMNNERKLARLREDNVIKAQSGVAASINMRKQFSAQIEKSVAALNKQAAAAESANHKISDVNKEYKDFRKNVRSTRWGRLANGVLGLGKGFLSILTPLAGASRGMKIFALGAAAAAPVVGIISGLLAGLPALLIAAGAGIGAIAAGMNGLKAAIQPLKQAFKSVQTAVSQTFEKDLAPTIQKLTGLMPTLSSGLSDVASGLSTDASAFTDVVTSAQGMSQIQEILGNIQLFMVELTPALKAGVQTFLQMAAVGTRSFGYLTTSLNRFATQFQTMMQNAISDGSFQASLRGLSQLLDGVFYAFNQLFSAGMKIMGILGGPLKQAFINLAGPLSTLLVALAQGMAPILPVITQAIGNLFTAIQPLLVPLSQILVVAFQALSNIFQQLAPYIPAVAQAFSAVVSALAPLVGPLIRPLVALFGQLALILVQSLLPVLPTLIRAFGVVASVIVTLFPVLLQLMALLDLVVGAVMAVADVIGGHFVRAYTDMKNGWDNASKSMKLATETNFGKMASSIRGAANKGASALERATPRINSAVSQAARDAINQGRRGGDGFAGGLKAGGNAATNFMGTLPGKLRGSLGNTRGILNSAGHSIIGGLTSGMMDEFHGNTVGWLKSVAGYVMQFKGPLPYDRRILIPAGHAIMQGLQEGLTKGLVPVLRYVSTVAGQIHTALTVNTFSQGQDLANGWIKGIESRMSQLTSTLGQFGSEVVEVDWGTVSESTWGNLLDMGYRGDPTDSKEALYVSVRDGVKAALDGAEMRVHGPGIAKLVNDTNKTNSRR